MNERVCRQARLSPLTPARRGDTINQAQSEIFGTTRIRNEKTGIS
jgi:hypothetical protein